MAVDAAEHALSLDPNFAYARAVLGGATAALRGDLAGGARQLEQALALDPDHPDVLMIAGIFMGYGGLGRFDEAIPVLEYVRSRDPVYQVNLANLAGTYWFAGRWEDATETIRTILALNPGTAGGQWGLSIALLQMGELEEALAAAESEPSPPHRLLGVVLASHALGRQPEFERAFQELRAGFGEVLPEAVAMVYAYTGDADAAFEWLDRMESPGPMLLHFDPLVANLHDDPRWTAYRERIGQSEEELDAISFEVRVPR